MAIRKNTKKTPAKKIVKKAPTKRANTRKPKEASIVEEASMEQAVPVNEEMVAGSDVECGKRIHKMLENVIKDFPLGSFSASGMLDMRAANPVTEARGDVVQAVRDMVDAAIMLQVNASARRSEIDVLLAEQRLAVARFERAMDNLEQAIRA